MRIEEILALCEPIPETGCMIWMGYVNTNGYAEIKNLSGRIRVHRLSFAVSNGMPPEAIPAGLVVRHSCDVRCCVAPDHLSLGTTKDNSDDCVSRGRHSRAFREVDGKLCCRRGHDMALVGTRHRVTARAGHSIRLCRECKNITQREMRRRAREGRAVD